MNLKILLFNLILVLFSLMAFSQENLQPIAISPFIGDTLDRIEREYFRLFPGIKNFQEAFWHFNSDSLLMVNVRIKNKDELIHTTFPSTYSLSDLTRRITGVLVKNIKDEKVEPKEITTCDSLYTGVIYSYRNNNLTLIRDCCSDDNLSINNDLIRQISTSEIQTIKTKEPNFFRTLLTTSLGIIAFSAAGVILAPEKTVQERHLRTVYTFPNNTYTEEYFETKIEKDRGNIPYYGIAGAILGYFIGQAIKSSVEYNITDVDAKEVIKENSLLPTGINSTN